MKHLRFYTVQSKFLVWLTLAAFCIGVILAAGFYFHMRQVLEQEVKDKAALVFGQVDAVQKYVRQVLRPKMYEALPDHFIIEAMSSSYISRAIMDKTNNDGAEHLYRRVALNARNPNFEATPLESKLIRQFRVNQDMRVWQGNVRIDDSEYFVTARPVRFTASCMRCHGIAADAPPEVLELYGERGFGHELDSIDGLDFVGLPISASMAWIKERVFTYLFIIMLSALLFLLATQLVFKRVVANNLRVLTHIFRKSLSDTEGEQLLKDVESRDEIGELIDGVERLGEHLFDTRRQLQDYAANLEKKVDERTFALTQQAQNRQFDVDLFVKLLSNFNSAKNRPQLWRLALPLIAERFDLQKIAYVCTFSTNHSYVWPENMPAPELPENLVSLLTESRAHFDQDSAIIPVDSSHGNTEGLLCLYTKPGASFGDMDTAVLMAVGRQLGIAAEHLTALDDLLRNSANLNAIFESISDPLLLVENSGFVVVSNTAARDLAKELSEGRRSDGDIMPYMCPDDGEHAKLCGVSAVMQSGESITREITLESGRSFVLSFFPVLTDIEGVRDAGPKAERVVVYARETTQDKKMLVQVTQSEKMATVGKLAAGLAHEINNPLGVIICYAQLLREAGLSEQQNNDLDVIINHTNKAQNVLRDLLNFARPKASTTLEIDFGSAIEAVANVFRMQAEKKGAVILTEIPPDLPLVPVDSQVLEHITTNLIINALDEVPENEGRIELAVSHDPDRREVVLSVRDNGAGFAREVLPHVFDPFFSTKEVNEGTGLGLTMIYGFMSDLGGGVEAANHEDGGALFTLRFPALQEKS